MEQVAESLWISIFGGFQDPSDLLQSKRFDMKTFFWEIFLIFVTYFHGFESPIIPFLIFLPSFCRPWSSKKLMILSSTLLLDSKQEKTPEGYAYIHITRCCCSSHFLLISIHKNENITALFLTQNTFGIFGKWYHVVLWRNFLANITQCITNEVEG